MIMVSQYYNIMKKVKSYYVIKDLINLAIEKGITQREDKILDLMNYLLRNNRAEDAKKATEDKSYRNKPLVEVFGDGQ